MTTPPIAPAPAVHRTPTAPPHFVSPPGKQTPSLTATEATHKAPVTSGAATLETISAKIDALHALTTGQHALVVEKLEAMEAKSAATVTAPKA